MQSEPRLGRVVTRAALPQDLPQELGEPSDLADPIAQSSHALASNRLSGTRNRIIS